MNTPPQKSPEEQEKELREILRSDWWLFKILSADQAWGYLIPWPFPKLWAKFKHWRTRGERKSEPRIWANLVPDDSDDAPKPIESGLWTTLALALTAYVCWFTSKETLDHDHARASDAGKTLFTGAFLLGTLLSVSVSLPGQSLLKPLLTKSPRAIIFFASAFAWSLLWGLSGGVLLVFYGDWYPPVRILAIFVGFLGAFAELNTLLFVFRMYLMGLMDLVKATRQEEAKKKEGAK